jgi:hydrogenase maturation protease
MSDSFKPTPSPKPLIIGIGNTLMGDDGAGSRVVELLTARGASADFLQEPTPGMGLLTHLAGRSKVIFVDASEFGGKPGDIRRADRNRIVAVGKKSGLTIHDHGLLDVLDAAEKLDLLPMEVILYCIQQRRTDAGKGLSPEVEAACGEVAGMICDEIHYTFTENRSCPCHNY